MQRALDLAAVGRVSASGSRVVSAVDFRDVAFGILDHVSAFYEIGVAQADLGAGRETVELLGRVFHKVFAFNVKLAGELHLPCAHAFVFGVIDGIQFFLLAFGVVIDDQFDRIHDHHHALGFFVEVFAHAPFQKRHIDYVIPLGYPDFLGEQPDRFRRIASAAQPADGRHTRVVPAGNVVFLDQLQQFALAHHRVAQVQAGELDLLGRMDMQGLDEPVVERAVYLEFQGADGMGDAFNRVALPVRVVVHRVDAPFVAGTVVALVQDPVHDRVAHVHVGRCQIYLGAQGLGTVGEFPVLHPLEQIQVLFHAAGPPRARLGRLGRRSTVFGSLFLTQVVHVGLAFLDPLHGPVVKLLEVVRSVIFPVPLES